MRTNCVKSVLSLLNCAVARKGVDNRKISNFFYHHFSTSKSVLKNDMPFTVIKFAKSLTGGGMRKYAPNFDCYCPWTSSIVSYQLYLDFIITSIVTWEIHIFVKNFFEFFFEFCCQVLAKWSFLSWFYQIAKKSSTKVVRSRFRRVDSTPPLSLRSVSCFVCTPCV